MTRRPAIAAMAASLAMLSFAALPAPAAAPPRAPDTLRQIRALEAAGRFDLAVAALQARQSSLRAGQIAERRRIEFELERLDRIRQDYSLTRDELFAQLRDAVQDVTPDELERWIAEGRLDSRTIDGARYFLGVSRSNLFWRYPDIAARRIDPPDRSRYWQDVWQACAAIRDAARAAGMPYVTPRTFKVVMRLTADADAAPAGSTIRAWLPIPRRSASQRGFGLLRTSSPIVSMADERSPIRSVCLDRSAVAGKPTEFTIEYRYTTSAVHFDLSPERALPADRGDAALRAYLREGPHVAFTTEIRRLSDAIAGGETNPLVRARRIYDWIADSIRYSYAAEYSTIDNLGEFCRSRGYGDCGQEAMLLITLCRFAGIPARWQSGWLTIPGGKTIHDWAEVHVRPWGWVPVDPYMAILATRNATGITDEQRHQVRDFYFGGLDPYRMTANADHCRELSPPKRSPRSDDVDFQRGELEWGAHNIYFDKYSYALTVEEVGATP